MRGRRDGREARECPARSARISPPPLPARQDRARARRMSRRTSLATRAKVPMREHAQRVAASGAPSGCEERLRDIALAGVGHDHDHAPAPGLGPGRNLERRPQRRPARDPASNPSRRAQRQAVWIASSSETQITSSSSSRFRTAGTKPAPIPWILCGPGCLLRAPPSRRARRPPPAVWGCDRAGTRPPPVMVPPVPTPAISTSTRPSSACSISGPVVRLCTSGLAGFENWSGRKASSGGRPERGRPGPPRSCLPATR